MIVSGGHVSDQNKSHTGLLAHLTCRSDLVCFTHCQLTCLQGVHSAPLLQFDRHTCDTMYLCHVSVSKGPVVWWCSVLCSL